MPENKKIDRRVIYTKRAIRDSFIELQQQKPIEKISVTEICKLADINRGTFYSHYSDPYDLRNSLQNELVEALEKRVAELGVKSLSCEQTLVLFKDCRELCRIFAGPNANKAALLDIVSNQTEGFLSLYDEIISDIPEDKLEYIRMFTVSIIAITVKKWIDAGLEGDPTEIADILRTFCGRGICGFIPEL